MDIGDYSGGGVSSKLTTICLRRTYDWSTTAPSIAAIEALANLENADPTGLATTFDICLYDYVDPDALDTLVRDGKSGSVTVTVTIERYLLLFDGDELVVFELDEPSLG